MKHASRVFCCGLLSVTALGWTGPSASAARGYEIEWYTMDGGGGVLTAAGYELDGSIGQPDVGVSAGGAYELSGGFRTTLPPSCPADVNGDGVVNVNDLLTVLANWGACAPPCPPYCLADINEDCAVNVLDLLEVLAHWGPCS